MQSTFQRLAADINGHPVNATLSVGMVFSPEGPLDLPALLVQTDEALYLAKELGLNRIEIATPETCGGRHPQPRPSPLRSARR